MAHESGVAPRLLIVEDDAAMRQLLAARFRSGGYDVMEAANASEALRTRGPHGDFDLVLTDVHLPGGSGIDLARSLHETLPFVPVVFVSGDADANVIREALNTESSAAYMIKPFAMSELDAVVDLVLRHSRAFTTPNHEEMEARLAEMAPVAPARFKNRIAHLVNPPLTKAKTVRPAVKPVRNLTSDSATRPSRHPTSDTAAPVGTAHAHGTPGALTFRHVVVLAVLAAIVVIATMVLSAAG